MLEKCPYCSTKVKSTDQQVNCPSCGTLYHYTCWKHFTEKCANCGLENDDYKEAKRKAEERRVEEKLRLEEEEQKRLQEEQQRILEEQLELQKEYGQQEKIRQEKERQERKQREEQYSLRLDNLRKQSFNGYYEYKVISLSDVSGLFKKNSGQVDIGTMTQVLNDLGLDGWHLVTAYSNELGKNALSGGVGGALLGVNSTVDENILIFERFVKI